MSKRLTDRERLLFKLHRLTDNEIKQLLDYITGLEQTRRERATPERAGDDELLTMLSSSYENRRARQVFEWEAARRKAEGSALAQAARSARH
jgi:hypothetical protein